MLRSLLFSLVLLSAVSARAQQTIFVSPAGTVLGSGTITSPVDMTTALSRVTPGDTVYVRGGTYSYNRPLQIRVSGEEGARIQMWAYADEEPVFDFTGANKGFDIRGGYLHLKGLTAENSFDNGIYMTGVEANHNILELLVARYNGDSGVQVDKGAAFNLLLNIDSYENYDPSNNGENADGFAVKFGVGEGNVLRGCRAWGNSDDGYDFWSLDDPDQQGVLIEGNWAFRNGFNTFGDTSFRGDSNGFKLGKGNGAHTLIRNVAWDHRAHGFDVNGNASGVTVYNNTAYLNRGVNFNFDDDPGIDEQAPYVLRNNASVASSVRMDATVVDEAYNTWETSVPSAQTNDFVSVDDTGADGPRQPDGSLPVLDFLRLADGSDLIDAGTDVGLSFAGGAPDLGAYETGTSVSAEPGIDRRVSLELAGPNPVRDDTRLAVTLDASRVARVAVYDLRGRQLAVLANGPLPGGRSLLFFDAAQLAPGTYLVGLEAGSSRTTLSITVAR